MNKENLQKKINDHKREISKVDQDIKKIQDLLKEKVADFREREKVINDLVKRGNAEIGQLALSREKLISKNEELNEWIDAGEKKKMPARKMKKAIKKAK